MEWQKQKEKEKQKEKSVSRKLTVEEKMEIIRVMEKKEDEKEDLIKIK